MSDLGYYIGDPDWDKFMEAGMRPPNQGFMRRWIQGSVGGQSPMQLYSNEYAFLRMKHGQNNILPYRGGIQNFNHAVTPELHSEVFQCSQETLNPAGCQMTAVQHAFDQKALTPHPFGASYKSGRGMLEARMLPPLPRNSNLL